MTTYPNVPNVPGVPALPRDPYAAAAALPTLLRADSFGGYGSGLSPSWGIYLDGQPVVIADIVPGMEFKREWAIADYPVERGGFESYDKVDIPYQPRVTFAAGRTEAARQSLLTSLDAIAGTLTLYDVVTPEVIYSSVNVQHYDYRRHARNGVNLLVVDVWLLEVRVQGITDQQNAKAASGNATVQNGSVSPWPDVTPTQESVQTIAATAQGANAFSLSQFPAVPSTNTSTQFTLLSVE